MTFLLYKKEEEIKDDISIKSVRDSLKSLNGQLGYLACAPILSIEDKFALKAAISFIYKAYSTLELVIDK
ncbi:MAG: hypothetical protein WCP65_00165 [Bacteroidota bacterium]